MSKNEWLLPISVILIFIAVWFYTEGGTHNDDKKTNIIDLSSFSPEIQSGSTTRFTIPYKYNSTYYGSNYFQFYLSFPTTELPFPKIGPTPKNDLRILVRAEQNHNHLRSVYSTRDSLAKLKSSGKIGNFHIYKETIGRNGSTTLTHYIKFDTSGLPIIITQAGDLNRRAYRAIDNGLEIDFVFSKEFNINDWDKLDDYILGVLNSFKELPNKSLKSQPSAVGTPQSGAP